MVWHSLHNDCLRPATYISACPGMDQEARKQIQVYTRMYNPLTFCNAPLPAPLFQSPSRLALCAAVTSLLSDTYIRRRKKLAREKETVFRISVPLTEADFRGGRDKGSETRHSHSRAALDRERNKELANKQRGAQGCVCGGGGRGGLFAVKYFRGVFLGGVGPSVLATVE